MSIKQLRLEKGLTQEKCATYLGIPLRTYKRYEATEDSINEIKRGFIISRLSMYGFVDETHGILSVEKITEICSEVFSKYHVEYCYLFGSYAKGKEKETSDVDLLVSVPINGLMFYELVESLREKLHKKIDLLDVTQLDNNPELMREILKDGIKIYGFYKK